MMASTSSTTKAMAYVCANCHGEFVSERPEEDALAEAESNWAGTPDTMAMDIVCDDCYQEFMQWHRKTTN